MRWRSLPRWNWVWDRSTYGSRMREPAAGQSFSRLRTSIGCVVATACDEPCSSLSGAPARHVEPGIRPSHPDPRRRLGDAAHSNCRRPCPLVPTLTVNHARHQIGLDAQRAEAGHADAPRGVGMVEPFIKSECDILGDCVVGFPRRGGRDRRQRSVRWPNADPEPSGNPRVDATARCRSRRVARQSVSAFQLMSPGRRVPNGIAR